MTGQIQWTISLVLVALFVVAIVGFTIGFANDNNSAVSITDDPEISSLYTSTTGNLSGFNGGSEDTYTSVVTSMISSSSASGTTQTAGQFAVTPGNLISVIKNTIEVGYIKIFGTSSGFGIFMTSLLGIIVFITGLLIWKTWAGRIPD